MESSARSVSRRRRRSVLLTAIVAVALGACGDDRPDASSWAERWVEQRDSIPTAEVLVEGGPDLCGTLLGDLRVGTAELTPTPDEALDAVVDEWRRLAESVAFDCPDDLDDAERRIRELDTLAREIDAGLDDVDE